MKSTRTIAQKKLVLRAEYDEEGEGGFGFGDVHLEVPGDEANVFHIASKRNVWSLEREMIQALNESRRVEGLHGVQIRLARRLSVVHWIVTLGLFLYLVLVR